MIISKVIKRTFEAKSFPKGSPERARLNESNITSEFMSSYRYVTEVNNTESTDCKNNPYRRVFRTKAEAHAFAMMQGGRIDDSIETQLQRSAVAQEQLREMRREG